MSSRSEFHIVLGLEEPQSAAEVTEATTLDGMRRAIYKGSYESSLIRALLDRARYAGLSGEDTYVTLAYHALIALEKEHRAHMRLLSLTPMPPIIMEKEKAKILDK